MSGVVRIYVRIIHAVIIKKQQPTAGEEAGHSGPRAERARIMYVLRRPPSSASIAKHSKARKQAGKNLPGYVRVYTAAKRNE